MTNQSTGDGTAEGQSGSGAAGSQTSEAEVTKLREDLAASDLLVKEGTDAMELANKSISELQVANKKFANDAVGLANQAEQITEARTALEESRKTSAGLQTRLDESNITNQTMQEANTTRRRADLVSRFSLPEDHVAGLDDAGLTVLESTLPHIKPGTDNPAKVLPITGNGLGLGAGSGSGDVAGLTDSERALRTIDRLKSTVNP